MIDINSRFCGTDEYDYVEAVLGEALERLRDGDILGFGKLMLGPLDRIRRQFDPAVWMDKVIPHARLHPLYPLALLCPFSLRSAARPRGYPGDAVLMDFLYRKETVELYMLRANELGRMIANFWTASPAAVAVRERCRLLGQMIDELAETRANASVLSVACGHFREALTSKAVSVGRIRVVGMDQDQKSLDYVARHSTNTAIELRQLSILKLLKGKAFDETFDLAYASGLNDYLEDRICKRLCSALFGMLKPGGRMVIPNFLPTAVNRASMEYLQDWFLIYRDQKAIKALAAGIDPDHIDGIDYFEDKTNTIGYAVVTKRGGSRMVRGGT